MARKRDTADWSYSEKAGGRYWPANGRVESAILIELEARGGSAKPDDELYDAIGKRCRITEWHRTYTHAHEGKSDGTGRKNYIYWKTRVRAANNRLRDKKLLLRNEAGEPWRLSADGRRQALEAQKAWTRPEACPGGDR